jgi:hypothetical protein
LGKYRWQKKKETKKKFKNGKCKVLIICYFFFFFSFSDVKNKIENKKEVLMAWKKYKLGDLIELCDERNTEGKYTLDDVWHLYR